MVLEARGWVGWIEETDALTSGYFSSKSRVLIFLCASPLQGGVMFDYLNFLVASLESARCADSKTSSGVLMMRFGQGCVYLMVVGSQKSNI